MAQAQWHLFHYYIHDYTYIKSVVLYRCWRVKDKAVVAGRKLRPRRFVEISCDYI